MKAAAKVVAFQITSNCIPLIFSASALAIRQVTCKKILALRLEPW
jgi:hypothetical protein